MSADSYGHFYYCLKVIPELSPDGEIYAYADRIVLQDGALLLLHADKDGEDIPVLIVAAGQWRAFFAASCLDGAACAVEHWAGEVSR